MDPRAPPQYDPIIYDIKYSLDHPPEMLELVRSAAVRPSRRWGPSPFITWNRSMMSACIATELRERERERERDSQTNREKDRKFKIKMR